MPCRQAHLQGSTTLPHIGQRWPQKTQRDTRTPRCSSRYKPRWSGLGSTRRCLQGSCCTLQRQPSCRCLPHKWTRWMRWIPPCRRTLLYRAHYRQLTPGLPCCHMHPLGRTDSQHQHLRCTFPPRTASTQKEQGGIFTASASTVRKTAHTYASHGHSRVMLCLGQRQQVVRS